jgi:hypothetical protein
MYSTNPVYQGQNWEAKAFGLEGGHHGATQAVEHTRSVSFGLGLAVSIGSFLREGRRTGGVIVGWGCSS